MNISTNAIGNYSAVRMRTNVHKQQETVKVEQKKSNADLNAKEKSFFSGLYPEHRSEIDNYHFYNKSGSMLGVSKGSLFDRRG